MSRTEFIIHSLREDLCFCDILGYVTEGRWPHGEGGVDAQTFYRL
jgi:hypothetical protein